ncbi:fingers domain of DNA polymerase lambda-domain-containing protein [Geranomyces variabilis]|nr:fingers domain of DNA polymerase lambda-domain-containing protein [Geranomyces variabilis]
MRGRAWFIFRRRWSRNDCLAPHFCFAIFSKLTKIPSISLMQRVSILLPRCPRVYRFARPVLSAGAAKPLVTSQGGRKTRKTANKRVVSEKQTTGKGPVSDNPAAAAPQKCQSKLAESETSKAAVLERFSALHGCGPKTALKWYHEYGYRTLDDLRTSDKLTHNQKVGVRFYDDLRQKMPRAEAEAIGAYVEKAAKSFDSGYQCHIMGSYR